MERNNEMTNQEKVDLLPQQYEPKRFNRWILKIPGLDSFYFKKIKLPKFEVIKYNLELIKTFEVEMYSPIEPSSVRHIFNLAVQNAIPEIEFNDLDAIGNKVSKWQFLNCKISNVDFGSYDYDDKGLSTIKIIFSFEMINVE